MELLGLLLPVVIDVINRKIANSDVRFWVSVGVCAVVGVFLNFLQTGFDYLNGMEALQAISTSVIIVFGLAQFSFQAIYERAGIKNMLRENTVTEKTLKK